ncbi:MAG: hypothetical protein AAGJ08_05345 [Cyanobacteria bacterium P01_H01_bin.35]
MGSQQNEINPPPLHMVININITQGCRLTAVRAIDKLISYNKIFGETRP